MGIPSDNGQYLVNVEKKGRTSSHNTLLKDAEGSFQPKLATEQQNNSDKYRLKASNESRNHEAQSLGLSSVIGEKLCRKSRR